MKEKLIIKGSVKIRNNTIFLNNDVIFHDDASMDYNDFIRHVYKSFKMDYPKFFKMDNLSKLGFISAEILIKNNNITGNYKGEDIGIVLSNSSSSLDTDKIYNDTIKDSNNYFPSPAVFVYTLPNIVIGEICIRHKITGENCFFISEKFNAEFLYKYISDLFEQNKIKCCITGWVDLLDNSYKSVLYFIEKSDINAKTNESIIFAPENLDKIFIS